jgi:hypothetical protein
MSGNSISSIISLQLSFASKLKNLSLHNNKIIRASTQIQIEKSDDSLSLLKCLMIFKAGHGELGEK